jgi:hypothetical protein
MPVLVEVGFDLRMRLSGDPFSFGTLKIVTSDDSTLHFRTLFSDLSRTLLRVGVCIDRQIVM